MIDRKLLKFTEECLNLNRTIVSKDNSKILKKIILILKSGYKVHKFPSGNTYGTWEIPKSWNVKYGLLLNLSKNKVVADYKDCKLFLAPYSKSINKIISKKELFKNCSFHPKLNNSYFYEHRLAYNFQLRGKVWRVSLPKKNFESIGKNDKLRI